MKPKWALLFFTCVIGFLGVEVGLRVMKRRLDLDNQPPASPFLYDPSIGYEMKPHAVLSTRDESGRRFLSTMNSEGFRDPERPLIKQPGTFRILALGDSVVESMTVHDPYTWETVLEKELSNVQTPVEVINAGVGGYVSWQAGQRLFRHGLRYHPDLVLVFVGWNDFIYSTLPIWKPGLDLSKIEAAYAAIEETHPKQDAWSRLKRGLSEYIFIVRLISHEHQNWNHQRRVKSLIAHHQIDSGRPFNGAALELYVKNLESLYRRSLETRTRMALITWPTILHPDLLNDSDVHQRILETYQNFPLSTKELWTGYSRYQEAQRMFARRHPDIRLIDVAASWYSLNRSERLRDFVDMAHLTIAGNRRFAETIAAQLRGAVP